MLASVKSAVTLKSVALIVWIASQVHNIGVLHQLTQPQVSSQLAPACEKALDLVYKKIFLPRGQGWIQNHSKM